MQIMHVRVCAHVYMRMIGYACAPPQIYQRIYQCIECGTRALAILFEAVAVVSAQVPLTSPVIARSSDLP